MRTFQEALVFVTATDEGVVGEQHCIRLQAEFRNDVFGSGTARTFGNQLIRVMLEHGEKPDTITANDLQMLFLNALCLGVTVGVQMERTALEPRPRWWRRAFDWINSPLRLW